MIKAAIFDMDGVIVTTVSVHFKAWKKMFSGYGKEFSFDDYKKKVDGIPRMDGARAILSDLSQEELAKAASIKQEFFLEFLKKEKIQVYESTIDLIRKLKENKIKTGVISASKNCRFVLEKVSLISMFETIVDGHQISKGKPDPQVFLIAAKRLEVSPCECVVFEDAVLGVEAAKRANMLCVGIDRYQNPQRLKAADKVVSDLSEISLEKLEELASL